MKIGVISDTHLRGYDESFKQIIELHFSGVDAIFHAGDLVDTEVLEMFPGWDVKAVCGNMDIILTDKLPAQLEFELEGIRFGLIHGWGSPSGLRKKLRQRFGAIDCLVYGHTHQAYNQIEDGVLYFNPGSPSGMRGPFLNQKTIGILEINNGISGRIINI